MPIIYDMKKVLKPLAWLALMASFTGLFAKPASTHPHGWIDIWVEVVFDAQGRATGLTQSWLFDDLYSVYAMEGIPLGSDGKRDRAQLEELTDKLVANLHEYDYFTKVIAHGIELKIGMVAGSEASVASDRLRMTFFMPFAEPVDLDGTALRYGVYDPTYYIEILHAKGGAVSFDNPPGDCRHRLEEPNPEPETVALAAALGPNEQGWDGIGDLFAQWVDVTCG